MTTSAIEVSGLRKAFGDNAFSVGVTYIDPGVRQFAEYQPFTPVIETVRGLLAGAPSAADAAAALAWCAGIGLAGYVWAVATFRKRV